MCLAGAEAKQIQPIGGCQQDCALCSVHTVHAWQRPGLERRWVKGRVAALYKGGDWVERRHSQSPAMKLLLFVCVCALAAAEQPSTTPTAGQLTIALQGLYRRFLHLAAPEEVVINDALEFKFRDGMMSNKRYVSPVRQIMPDFSDSEETERLIAGFVGRLEG